MSSFILNFLLSLRTTQIHEILREANQAPQAEMWLFNFGGGTARTKTTSFCDLVFEQTSVSKTPNALATKLSGLYVLQEFASLLLLSQNGSLSAQTIFFSSLASLTTLADCILRKLRGFLMVLSVDSVKRELLEENTPKSSTSSSSKQIPGPTSRKHKGKTGNTKKPTPEAKSDRNVSLSAKIIKVQIFCLSTYYFIFVAVVWELEFDL